MKIKIPDLKYLWQPAQEQTSSSPLMVVLHGRGDSMHGFESFKEELGLPTINFLLLNAPDPYFQGYSWYDLPPNQLPGIMKSRQLLEKVFQEIQDQGFDLSRCFLLGFSQGCLLTLEFGARYPHQLGGYIGLSGYCYDPEKLINEKHPEAAHGNWLITHGIYDEVLPISTARQQMQLLVNGGFNIEFREFAKGHALDPLKELPFLRQWIKKRILD